MAGSSRIRASSLSWCVALAFCAAGAYAQFAAGYVGDKHWLLLAARMWIGGKRLYSDIVEVNPPLILWICGLAVEIARIIPYLRDYQALVLMGLLALDLVLWLVNGLLSSHPQFNTSSQRAPFLLLLAFVFIVWTNPVYFGDREFWFLLLTLPYVLRYLPSLRQESFPRGRRLCIGLLAGIGYCIKPHCVIVFLGMQCVYMLGTRSWRILVSFENIVIYLVGVLYLAAILCFAPLYLAWVLPMALATYGDYGGKFQSVGYQLEALFVLAVTFVDFRPGWQTPYRRDIYYLLQLALFYLLYALANNGWGYTYNPLISLLLIVSGFVLFDFRHLKAQHPGNAALVRQCGFGMRDCWIIFGALTAFMAGAYATAFTAQCKDNAVCRLNDRVLETVRQADAHSFGTITTGYTLWPNLAEASGAHWDTRFNHLWMLPRFFNEGADFTGRHRDILLYVATSLSRDMNGRRPEVVFVDNNRTFAGGTKQVDLAAYFSAFPVFAAAWSHYRYTGSIPTCARTERGYCSIDVYRRIPEASAGKSLK